jgi:calcium-dependent protein kinase
VLQDAIKQWGHKIPADEVTAIMSAADVDGDGVIDYNEFVAATINVNQLEKEDLIYKAFQEFDEDCSNAISLEELEKVRLLSGVFVFTSAYVAGNIICGCIAGTNQVWHP